MFVQLDFVFPSIYTESLNILLHIAFDCSTQLYVGVCCSEMNNCSNIQLLLCYLNLIYYRMNKLQTLRDFKINFCNIEQQTYNIIHFAFTSLFLKSDISISIPCTLNETINSMITKFLPLYSVRNTTRVSIDNYVIHSTTFHSTNWHSLPYFYTMSWIFLLINCFLGIVLFFKN